MGRNKLRKTLCPICGEYYFTEPSEDELKNGVLPSDEFCITCGWKFDERQINNNDLKTDINKLSINEYRELYKNKIRENPNYNYLDENKPDPIPHICPVCGKYKFSDELSYEICPYCGWEDDGFDAEHLKNDISACGCTYLEYKTKYEDLLKNNPNYKWKDTDN